MEPVSTDAIRRSLLQAMREEWGPDTAYDDEGRLSFVVKSEDGQSLLVRVLLRNTELMEMWWPAARSAQLVYGAMPPIEAAGLGLRDLLWEYLAGVEDETGTHDVQTLKRQFIPGASDEPNC